MTTIVNNPKTKISVKSYDGDKKNFQTFHDSLKLYFLFHKDQYEGKDGKKIAFVLSKLDSGEAELWRRTYLTLNPDIKADAKYDDFWTKVKEQFEKGNQVEDTYYELNHLRQKSDETAETLIS